MTSNNKKKTKCRQCGNTIYLNKGDNENATRFCSIECACYAGEFNVKTGWNDRQNKEFAEVYDMGFKKGQENASDKMAMTILQLLREKLDLESENEEIKQKIKEAGLLIKNMK